MLYVEKQARILSYSLLSTNHNWIIICSLKTLTNNNLENWFAKKKTSRKLHCKVNNFRGREKITFVNSVLKKSRKLYRQDCSLGEFKTCKMFMI